MPPFGCQKAPIAGMVYSVILQYYKKRNIAMPEEDGSFEVVIAKTTLKMTFKSLRPGFL
jgi:hypothetical protein